MKRIFKAIGTALLTGVVAASTFTGVGINVQAAGAKIPSDAVGTYKTIIEANHDDVQKMVLTEDQVIFEHKDKHTDTPGFWVPDGDNIIVVAARHNSGVYPSADEIKDAQDAGKDIPGVIGYWHIMKATQDGTWDAAEIAYRYESAYETKNGEYVYEILKKDSATPEIPEVKKEEPKKEEPKKDEPKKEEPKQEEEQHTHSFHWDVEADGSKTYRCDCGAVENTMSAAQVAGNTYADRVFDAIQKAENGSTVNFNAKDWACFSKKMVNELKAKNVTMNVTFEYKKHTYTFTIKPTDDLTNLESNGFYGFMNLVGALGGHEITK